MEFIFPCKSLKKLVSLKNWLPICLFLPDSSTEHKSITFAELWIYLPKSKMKSPKFSDSKKQ